MVYLDNASTTTQLFFTSEFDEDLHNMNAGYAYKERQIYEDCCNAVREVLGVHDGKVLFFKNATQAFEFLSKKFADGWDIACSAYEHDSVNNNCVFNVCYDDRMMFCHQLVNPVTGAIFDIKRIAKDVKDAYYFGSDLTAAIGKTPLPDDLEDYCDALWFSGHKFHAPMVGCLWISNRLARKFGASNNSKNQYGLVHGTIDVNEIRAFCKALKEAEANGRDESLAAVFNQFSLIINYNFKENGIALVEPPNLQNQYIIGWADPIVALTFRDINAEALQTFLATRDIYIGIGASACSEESDYRVLKAFGYTEEQAENTIRISFSQLTTLEEVEEFIKGVIDFKETFLG